MRRGDATTLNSRLECWLHATEFIALALPSPEAVPAVPGDIRIELRRGATSIAVSWPLAAADQCAARRLNDGRFVWPRQAPAEGTVTTLTQPQFDALVLGLPWQRLEQMRVITRM